MIYCSHVEKKITNYEVREFIFRFLRNLLFKKYLEMLFTFLTL